MRFKDYSGTEQFRPLSAWAYFGYGILFATPIIGWFFLIVFTFSTKNYNRRSFTRSYWCSMIVAGIVIAVFMATGVGFGWLYETVPALRQWLPERKTTITTTVQSTGIPTVKETIQTAKTTIPPSAEPTKNVGKSDSGTTPEFKKTMDGYEAFFDSYIEFMESFDSSNSTLTQLAKYTEMMTQYSEAMEALDQIDDSTLSEVDEQYQIEVMLRINQKLATFAAKQ